MFSIFDWRRKEAAEIMKYKCRHKSAYMVLFFCCFFQTNHDSAVHRRQARHFILPKSQHKIVQNHNHSNYKTLDFDFGSDDGIVFIAAHSFHFLFPHSRFSHWWCRFSMQPNERSLVPHGVHCRRASHSMRWMCICRCIHYICHRLHFSSHHLDAPTNQNNKSNAYFCHRAARHPFHLLFVWIFGVSPQLNYPRSECKKSSRRAHAFDRRASDALLLTQPMQTKWTPGVVIWWKRK